MYFKNANASVTVPFTLDLSQAANTYDLCSAGGDCLVKLEVVYVTTVGATWTSVSIQSNDTVPFICFSAADGAVANFVATTNLAPTLSRTFFLKRGKKLQYTIVGATGSGGAQAYVTYIPLVPYAALS